MMAFPPLFWLQPFSLALLFLPLLLPPALAPLPLNLHQFQFSFLALLLFLLQS